MKKIFYTLLFLFVCLVVFLSFKNREVPVTLIGKVQGMSDDYCSAMVCLNKNGSEERNCEYHQYINKEGLFSLTFSSMENEFVFVDILNENKGYPRIREKVYIPSGQKKIAMHTIQLARLFGPQNGHKRMSEGLPSIRIFDSSDLTNFTLIDLDQIAFFSNLKLIGQRELIEPSQLDGTKEKISRGNVYSANLKKIDSKMLIENIYLFEISNYEEPAISEKLPGDAKE